jgi:hypothetical protein
VAILTSGRRFIGSIQSRVSFGSKSLRSFVRIPNSRTGRVLGGRVIVRSGDAMCGLYRARGDEEHGFLG